MKSVLISIQPKWVEKIVNGEKTIEVRKTRPKCDVPFKCYIYCTKEKLINNVLLIYGGGKYACFGDYRNACTSDADGKVDCYIGNGKIIGEFVCNRITDISVVVKNCNEDYNHVYHNDECKGSCLTWKELQEYSKGKPLYAWHISDLKIYGSPLTLDDFYLEKAPESWRYV